MGCISTKKVDAYSPGVVPNGGSSKSGSKNKAEAQAENERFFQTMQFVNTVPLFKRLPKDQHPLLAKSCEAAVYKPGATVIREGEEGNEFFAIRKGEATVLVGHKTMATLKPGDYFGEEALIHDELRSATIVAINELHTLKISRPRFVELGLTDQLLFVNRKAVPGGGAERKLAVKPPSPKSPEDRKLLQKALLTNPNLQTFVKLEDKDERIEPIVDVAWREEVAAGKQLITEGELDADYFYIVQEGTFDVMQGTGSEMRKVAEVGPGGSFGDLALLCLVPRAATVKARTAGVVWVIDRLNFKSILMQKSEDEIKSHVKYLENCEVLAPLTNDEKFSIAHALVLMKFELGEVIVQQGEQGNCMYILYEGSVGVSKDGGEETTLEASEARGTAHLFGEKALLSSETRTATVKTLSKVALVYALDREDFNFLLGPLKDILDGSGKKSAEGKAAAAKAKKTGGKAKARSFSSREASKVSKKSPMPGSSTGRILREELSKIGLLGCGGFGAVELYEHKQSGESYAMKALSKGYIVQTGMKSSVMNEKTILMMTNSPFVIKLFECYNSPQSLYFLLEPALGGELYATYNKKGFHGKEQHAKFYAAGVVLSFEHLHMRHIIYRDLKPENLLLNDQGQIKLTDMGLAKFVVGTTYTTCGTPDYFAPELIASTGHSSALDWWTLGILIFELMSGHPPFESDTPMMTYSKVMRGIDAIPFPAKCKGVTGDLIKGLLMKDPSDRIPMKAGGTKQLRGHPWFNGFDWEAMENLTMAPPYKPVVKSKTDVKNFSAREADMPPQVPYKDDGSGWDKDFATST